MKEINKAIPKVDGMSLVLGKPVYTEDLAFNNALIVKMLRSPHAFARVKSINIDRAMKLEGVECVLTYQDVPRKPFTRAGQSYPEPSTYDKFILDEYVRYVGDEVAIVAATTEAIAEKALKLIKVEYEVLEPVLDFEQAEGHPSVIHPEPEAHALKDTGFDPRRNVAATFDTSFGDLEGVMTACDVVVKGRYYSQAQAHAMMETHRAFTYLDHQGRLVITSSTQVPFHVRRIVAYSLDIPVSKVRVVKPRIGGGFGGKQALHSEFFVAAVTLKTGKPAKIIYTRQEAFESTYSRHAMRFDITIGATKDGTIKAIEMQGLSNTGGYGEHAQSVFAASGLKVLPMYNKVDALKYGGKVVYTNQTPGGALRGYGVTQGNFALESAMNQLAEELNMDPTLLRQKNITGMGETHPFYKKAPNGAQITIDSCELEYCINKGKELIGWDAKFPIKAVAPNKARGVGMAVSMQGAGIPNIDMAGATIKLNEEGSFNLLVGATDLGTGSDTILGQIAAEALGVSSEKVIVYSSDTDITPFDTGAYASSTTYVSGNAVKKAAESMRQMIAEEGAKCLGIDVTAVEFNGEKVSSVDGYSEISLVQLSLQLLYSQNQKQLVASESFCSHKSPPPFLAGFAEVEVDLETGKVDLVDYVAVIDGGTLINPNLARIQVEGGLVQGIGMAMFEEVKRNSRGKLITNNLMQYKIPTREDINKITVEFVESYEPDGPYGAKSVGEVCINTPPAAIVAAVYNATGVRITSLPVTPEKVLLGLKERHNSKEA
ncbi:MAG: molybdopterin cofactor-binding domain-containing protein [Bacillota bacterium]|nr:molybdopterin cofactor-binding domain-containing protein [Bacillota bacterium]